MMNEFEIPAPETIEVEPDMAVKAADNKIDQNGKMILIIIAALCVLTCLCSAVFITAGVYGIGSVVKERKPVSDVLDEFMIDMARNDMQAAYELFSPRAQRQTTIAALTDMRARNNVVLFEDYQSLRIYNINITATVNSDPDEPQGTVATVSGVIFYQAGQTGEFEAILEKVDDRWMMFSFDLWLGTPSNTDDVSAQSLPGVFRMIA